MSVEVEANPAEAEKQKTSGMAVALSYAGDSQFLLEKLQQLFGEFPNIPFRENFEALQLLYQSGDEKLAAVANQLSGFMSGNLWVLANGDPADITTEIAQDLIFGFALVGLQHAFKSGKVPALTP